MATLMLPLESLILSIGIEGETGPRVNEEGTLLDLEFSKLTAGTLRQIAPDRVVGWLFCANYDVYDIAHMLTGAGFRGRLQAVAADLPNRSAIAREIRANFPRLDFELVCPADLSVRAADYHGFVAEAGAEPDMPTVPA